MGFFDKKSRQMRRKIKDLQAELAAADKQADYVVHSGIFFANLEDMGEQTMLAFGSTDAHSGAEEDVIRAFMDRNGFTVEEIKLSRGGRDLDHILIVPSNEFLKWIAKHMQADGLRVIDDGDEEREADLERRIMPISVTARVCALLFCQNVRQIIANTPVKMTKEGNRLLSWLPLIVAHHKARIDAQSIEIVTPYFSDAFESFYAKVDKSSGEERDNRRQREDAGFKADTAPEYQARKSAGGGNGGTPTPPPTSSSPTPAPGSLRIDRVPRNDDTPEPRLAPVAEPTDDEIIMLRRQVERLTHSEHTEKLMASLYKMLIKANPSRCLKTTEAMLQPINRTFKATATCILLKSQSSGQWSIYAQSGKELTWGEGAGGKGFPVSTTVIRNCYKRGTIVTNDPRENADPTQSMISFHIEAAVAAPIKVYGEIMGILYLDRRDQHQMFSRDDVALLEKVAQVFEEYPDLMLGIGG